jgi:hypothetical protein
VLTPESARRQHDLLVLNPELPQFPVGTQAALVRQMLVVDSEGRITNTRVTESVQLRVFRTISKWTPEEDRRDKPADQAFHEFTRSRALLFADKTGGLRPLTLDDRDFRTQFLVHPHDELEPRDGVAPDPRMAQTMRGCLGCHDRPGIHAFRTYTGGDFPRGRFHLPSLAENRDAGSQAELTAMRKRDQYSWGLLQGLWKD